MKKSTTTLLFLSISYLCLAQTDIQPDQIILNPSFDDSFIIVNNSGDSVGYDMRFYDNEDFVINELNVATRFIIARGGNVGIGNNLFPSAALQVIAREEPRPEINGIFLENQYDSTSQNATFASRVAGSFSGDPYISFDISNVTGWSAGVDNSDADKFKIANTYDELGVNTKLTIQTDGNVGIATDQPTCTLDVDGDLRIRNLSSTTDFLEFVLIDSDGKLYKQNLVARGSDQAFEKLKQQNSALEKRVADLERMVLKLVKE